jgi:hypothetical protein
VPSLLSRSVGARVPPPYSLRAEFWRTKLTLAQRLCYLSGMLYYWSAALGIFFVPIPGIFMIWIRPNLLKYYNLAFALPSIIYGLLVFRLWARSTHSLAVQYIRVVQSYAYLSGLSRLVFGTISDWVPTGDTKSHTTNHYRNMRVLAICWTFAFQGAFISGCAYRILLGSAEWYQFVPL